MDSPVGKLMIGSSKDGICKISFARSVEAEFFSWLEDNFPQCVYREDKKANARYVAAIESYFAGRKQKFDFKFELVAEGFRRKVLMALSKVPYGTAVSYGELAALAGSPRASRAAGSACATNPLPLVIPCHRVIAAGGRIGGYGGGLEHKKFLLRLEDVDFKD